MRTTIIIINIIIIIIIIIIKCRVCVCNVRRGQRTFFLVLKPGPLKCAL